jgi:hypothetical protein
LYPKENRDFFPERQTRFFADRQVDVYLKGFGPQGEVNIATKVDDFTVALLADGLKHTEARIHLQAHLRSSLRNSLDPETCKDNDEVAVVFNAEPPHVGELAVPGKANQGQPVSVSFTVEDLSGIKEVQYGFDLDQSENLEPAEKPGKLLEPDTDGQWRFSLPTKDLQPGRYVVLVIATDRVGLPSKQHASVRILAAKPVEVGTPPIAESILEGKVVWTSGEPIPGVDVHIRGTDLKATTDDAGLFKFPAKLPNGKYTLDLSGTPKGHAVSGSQSVTLPVSKLEIPLEW